MPYEYPINIICEKVAELLNEVAKLKSNAEEDRVDYVLAHIEVATRTVKDMAEEDL